MKIAPLFDAQTELTDAAAGQVTAARAEESEGRLAHLLVQPVSRRRCTCARLSEKSAVSDAEKKAESASRTAFRPTIPSHFPSQICHRAIGFVTTI